METKPRWSWKIGELADISIRVHITLVALFAWILLGHAVAGASLTEIVFGGLLVALVFAIIVIHELAHALVARRYGCRTREILLLPIGGLARMDRVPERPHQELLVALAGPAVNVALALVLAAVVAATGGSFDPVEAATIGGALASQLMWINITLAGFNLLPAIPMDGGRAFRAFLAIWIGHARATRIAGVVARVLAAGFVLVGLMLNPMLAVIGVFVWIAASHETAMVDLREAVEGATVREAMIVAPPMIETRDSLWRAAEISVASGHGYIVAIDHGRPIGLVTRSQLAVALATRNPQNTVSWAVRSEIPIVAEDDRLDTVMAPLERAEAALVVDDAKQLVGLLTLDQVLAYAAMHARAPARAPVIPILSRSS